MTLTNVAHQTAADDEALAEAARSDRAAFDVETDPLHAVKRRPETSEIPTGPLDAARFANPYPNLLEQSQQTPERLYDLGTEERVPWGTVRVIGYDWDGVTAQTDRYAGYPHTIFFKVTEAEKWLVEMGE